MWIEGLGVWVKSLESRVLGLGFRVEGRGQTGVLTKMGSS